MSSATLSAMRPPTTTVVPASVRAEVTTYSGSGASPRPAFRSTRPFVPKSGQKAPVSASSAISSAVIVFIRMRRWQGAPAGTGAGDTGVDPGSVGCAGAAAAS